MRSPAEFVVTRHLLGHPEDSPTDLARHCGLAPAVVSRVTKRLRDLPRVGPGDLLEHLQSLPERPPRKAVDLRLPNPELWFRAYQGPYLASGEPTAFGVDGMDLVPSKFLVYVSADQTDAAVGAAFDVMGKLAPTSEANFEIRVADRWLRAGEQENVAEKGQRLLDYQESRQIQVLRQLKAGRRGVHGPRVLSS